MRKKFVDQIPVKPENFDFFEKFDGNYLKFFKIIIKFSFSNIPYAELQNIVVFTWFNFFQIFILIAMLISELHLAN